jgi:hypothetical protein
VKTAENQLWDSLFFEEYSIHEKNKFIAKTISANKMRKKIQEYQSFVFRNIFPEYELKEYLDSVEKIVQKDSENKKRGFSTLSAYSAHMHTISMSSL